jgi:hypothetical protein
MNTNRGVPSSQPHMKGKKQLERTEWGKLPDLYVRLVRDNLGYPPKDWEQLKGESTGERGAYRIKSIPHYARGLAWEDEVSVTTSAEGYYPVVEKVIQRSGYSTVRLLIKSNEDRQELILHFTKMDTLLEFEGSLVALAIPRNRFDEVSEYVFQEKQRGRWDSEDGFLIIDADEDPKTQ